MRLAVLLLLPLLTLPLFAEKFHLNPTPTVPAATGEVDTGRDNNRNTTLDVKVEHLAHPGELSPPRQFYIVWAQPAGSAALKLGLLTVGNDLKGEFKSVTPMTNFDLYITAEDDPQTMAPHGPIVLRATVR